MSLLTFISTKNHVFKGHPVQYLSVQGREARSDLRPPEDASLKRAVEENRNLQSKGKLMERLLVEKDLRLKEVEVKFALQVQNHTNTIQSQAQQIQRLEKANAELQRANTSLSEQVTQKEEKLIQTVLSLQEKVEQLRAENEKLNLQMQQKLIRKASIEQLSLSQRNMAASQPRDAPYKIVVNQEQSLAQGPFPQKKPSSGNTPEVLTPENLSPVHANGLQHAGQFSLDINR